MTRPPLHIVDTDGSIKGQVDACNDTSFINFVGYGKDDGAVPQTVATKSENGDCAIWPDDRPMIHMEPADLIDARASEWLKGFKAGALFTLLCAMIGMGVAGWLA